MTRVLVNDKWLKSVVCLHWLWNSDEYSRSLICHRIGQTFQIIMWKHQCDHAMNGSAGVFSFHQRTSRIMITSEPKLLAMRSNRKTSNLLSQGSGQGSWASSSRTHTILQECIQHPGNQTHTHTQAEKTPWSCMLMLYRCKLDSLQTEQVLPSNSVRNSLQIHGVFNPMSSD